MLLLVDTQKNKVMKLYPGMIIKTNYSHREHLITSIYRNCTCPRYTDELGLTATGMEKCSPEHIHIGCKDLEDMMSSGFNGYIENDDGSIKNVWRPQDEITIVSTPKNMQLELF